jgi:hypothetical protein
VNRIKVWLVRFFPGAIAGIRAVAAGTSSQFVVLLLLSMLIALGYLILEGKLLAATGLALAWTSAFGVAGGSK